MMRVMKKPLMLLGTLVALYVAGRGLWRLSAHPPASGGTRQIVGYQDSMHPWVKSAGPGKCTICAMDLTPRYEGEGDSVANDDRVVLSSNRITVLNVQTDEVKRRPLRFTLRVAGTLDADESRKAIFSAPAAGRIHEMVVGAVGDEVEAAKPLLTFYSPELATWRRAYVVRSRTTSPTSPHFAGRVHEEAEDKMPTKPGMSSMPETHPTPGPSAPGMDPNFSDLLSPLSGTIVERKVFNGQYVMEGDRLLTIVDTSVLWFRFNVYERQLPWLHKGQKVQMTVPALPGREFSGVISVIEPTLDEATRTIKVRAAIPNPVVGDATQNQRLLRLGMFAEASVLAEVPDVLAVPRTAILSPGDRAYAYVDEGGGAYALRQVTLGRQGDGFCEILKGLTEGDRVVTAGNVLIDAQAQFTQPMRQEPTTDEGKTQLANSQTPLSARAEPANPEVVAELPSPGQTEPRATAPPLTKAQAKALDNFLGVANNISAALAADSFSDWQGSLPQVSGSASALSAEFGASHPWHQAVEGIAAAAVWPTAKDLTAARAAFLPFSTQVVRLVQLLQADTSEDRSLKVYHCPMAPKPGLWFQASEPLRNPYFGAKMLGCGEEVRRPAPSQTMVSRVAPPAPAPAPASTQPAPPVKTLRTMNTRHPEAKEQMLRAFGQGVAEQHRLANQRAVANSPATVTSGSEAAAEAREAIAMNRVASAVKSGLAEHNHSNTVARAVSP